MTTKTRAKKIESTWNESTVLDAIEAYYTDKSKGTFLRGVRNATGFSSDRTADGIYMGAWQSVGVQLHGFEVKVNRSDFMRELQDVSKSGAFEKFCHYWWIVCPEGVAKVEEMPSQWGLKIVSQTTTGTSIRVVKAASRNDSASLTYQFFSSCLRQCRRDDPNDAELKRHYEKGFAEGKNYEMGRNREDQHVRRLQMSVDEHIKKIADFEAASGIRIDNWYHDPKQVGQAVRFVLDHGPNAAKEFEQIVERCDFIKSRAEEFIKSVKETEAMSGRK